VYQTRAIGYVACRRCRRGFIPLWADAFVVKSSRVCIVCMSTVSVGYTIFESTRVNEVNVFIQITRIS